MIRDVELFPVLAVIRAAVGTPLRADVHGPGLLGMRGDAADGRRLGEALGHELPPVSADGHAIEAGFDGAARGGFSSQTDVDVRLPVGRHDALLLDSVSLFLARPAKGSIALSRR